MEKRQLNVATYFLLPLIDLTISLIEYINAGFVDLYLGDINRPYIDDKILLMFNSTKLASTDLTKRLHQNINYYNSYSIRINTVWYRIFVFIKPIDHKYEIELLPKTPQLSTYKTKVNIMMFWDMKANSNLHRALFEGCDIKSFYSIIPEEDLIIKDPVLRKIFEDEVAISTK